MAMMVSGAASRMFLAATNPSCRGIWMSMTTMSGRSSMARATPVAALGGDTHAGQPGTFSSAAASSSAKER